VDVIERAARLFDEVLVAVGDNPAKRAIFTAAERLEMVRREVGHLRNVRSACFCGLLVDFAKAQGATLVLRGIRGAADLEYELLMAVTNRCAAGVETLFIPPRPEYAFLSARLIKEIAASGGDVSAMVSASVAERLRARLASGRARE
jgi:Phosphopantetheine adenylyltransferase (EC 2.7.7.3)